jgi:xylitol oxidase
MIENRNNWAGNYEYAATALHVPQSVEQIQELVARCNKVKALGTRHSFNTIADTDADMISLQHLNRIVALDRERLTVTVEAGARYGEISDYLHREGFALHNLASLPHISVAGACATATHGSGVANGNLATAVSALEIVTANGAIVALSREQDGDQFLGAAVGLGGLGVVTKLTLDIQPTFNMRQNLYENLPLSQLETAFDAVMSSAYSVSLFTDWRDETINQVWLKRRIVDNELGAAQPVVFGATLATRNLHPIGDLSAENCTEQMGVPGAWHERLPHFRMNFTPSSGEELQSEYFVPRDAAYAAMSAVNQLGDRIAPHLLISEIRTIAADNLWMSPCYQQDSVAIHFTWKRDWLAVSKVLPLIEDRLAPFNARPHWGKLFTLSPHRLQSRYEKLADFQQLLRHYDPHGKFHNAFLETYIFGETH